MVDDDEHKHGMFLHGVPIVGTVAQLSGIALGFQAAEVIIAIPSATTEEIGRVVDACIATKLPFLIAPDPARTPSATARVPRRCASSDPPTSWAGRG